MPALFLLTLAIAPGAFLLWYFWHRDRLEREPREVVMRVFFLGMASCLPLALLEAPVPKPWDMIVAAPILEELGKFLVVFLFVYRLREFDEPMDGIVYGVAAALGFATLENILYVLQHGVGTGILRAVLSVPGHALWGCLWGYALGRAKFTKGPDGTRWVVVALLLAMLSHALFNFGCTGQVAWFILAPPLLVIIGWLLARRDIRDALRRAPLRWDALPPPGEPGVHAPPPRPPRPDAPPPPPSRFPRVPPPPPNDDRWKGLGG